ncbi:MAG: ATP-dependent Clp protease ATP-binding subunit [Methylococcales bacterium]|jgi:ATP-dependent Clp protease ATP-binding subunit ClpC|nr:ATP-dependent Clp protease ATP-binding subunit [Methylococcales bacterium]MBT7444017.1 ATP-dependent Clp protease ATP-binding subunit [Methylococcales bacterium]
MKITNFHALYWDIGDGQVYGVLLGTQCELYAQSVKKLKAAFIDWLVYESNLYGFNVEPELADITLRFDTVDIRPAYPGEKGRHPVPYNIKLPVVAAFGEDKEEGYSLCYLPFLNLQFYYYDQVQLVSLIQHFTHDLLDGLPPEEIHPYIMPCKPEMMIVRHKERLVTAESFQDPIITEAQAALSPVAERLPVKLAQKRRLIREQAWELGDHVAELADKIVRERANVLLLGESGVGKSTLFNEVITHLSKAGKKEGVPTFWRTDPQRMIADAKYLGEWQEGCEQMVDHLISANGVLWIQSVEQLIQLGGQGVEDSVAAFILPFIRAGQLQILAEITPKALQALRQKMPGFTEYFQVIPVTQMSDQKTLSILKHLQNYSDRELGIQVNDDAVQLGLRYCQRYFRAQQLPGKAVNFVQECLSYVWQTPEKVVDKSVVTQIAIRKTGLPDFILDDHKTLNPAEVTRFFQKKLIAQSHVIEALVSLIKVFKVGLNDPEKPIATLLFAGPTGVGKTAVAKRLSEFFFGAGQVNSPLYRLDMSEFQHPSQVMRLIGEPNGQPGPLIQHVRNSPFSVLLFDEIEKADPAIYDALMTVFDEGTLTDNLGRDTDFRHTIIIMTTNLGVGKVRSVGFAGKQSSFDETAIKRFFRPEFYNRMDQVLSFDALSRDDVEKIAGLELSQMSERVGFQSRGLTVSFSADVVSYIAQVGFHPEFGARPLQRAVEQQVVAPLARVLLEHPEWKNGVLTVKWEGIISVFFQKSQS